MTPATVVVVTLLGSGFSFGELGTRAQALGGAFTAQADDITAIRFNPAGLVQRPGLLVHAELQVRWHEVSFLRQDPGFDPAAPSRLINTVTNGGGAFLAPLGGAAYTFDAWGHAVSVALGAYGPPSVGRYRYPEPDYRLEGGEYVATPRRFAPQRYALVESDTTIAYPTVAGAVAITPWLSVGLSAQLVVSRFRLRQALFAGDVLGLNPMRQLEEDPAFDAVVTLDTAGQLSVTGILGVLVHPAPWLSIGASVRPPVPVSAGGTVDITLGPTLASLAQVEGNRTRLSLTLPAELALGARFTPLPWLAVAVEGRYETWSSVDVITLTPEDVFLVQGQSRTAIAPVVLPKRWVNTVIAAVGVTVSPLPVLSFHAGGRYEGQASPDTTYSIDFAHPSRVFVSGGVSARLGPVELLASVAWTPIVTSTITTSEVRRPQTDSSVQAGVIGAGVYTSGGTVLSVGALVHLPALAAGNRTTGDARPVR